MASQFLHVSCSLHIPSMLPSVAAPCFWFIVVFWSADWQPINATMYCILLFLCHSVWCPKQRDSVTQQAPRPARLVSNIQPVAATDCRLIVASYLVHQWPFKANVYFISIIFCCWFDDPNYVNKPPHTHSTPAVPLPNNALYHNHWLSIDCSVFWLNGSHLRPTPLSSLYFLMGLCLAPQTGELTASSAQPVPAPAPCMGTLAASATCVGGAADLP